jgi:hypothetical protein
MRTQWCREHIDQVASECGLGESVISDVKRADQFCQDHPDLSGCSTRAVMALIRIRDPTVRERTVSHAENRILERTPTGGVIRDNLTEKEVRWIIQKEEDKLRKEKGLPTKEEEGKNVEKFVEAAGKRLDEVLKEEGEPILDDSSLQGDLEDLKKKVGGFEEEDTVPALPISSSLTPIRISVTDSEGRSGNIYLTNGQDATIRQLVKYEIVTDELSAIQHVIDLGIIVALDEIEREFQKNLSGEEVEP